MINIPTISQLSASVIADLQAQYGTIISPTGKVFLRAIANVWAAKLRLQYLNLGRLQKNIFVDTADEASKGGTLERFGLVKLGRNPFQAVQGQYNITVTGTIGAVIPASTTFKSDDSSLNPSYLFILDVAHTMVTSSDIIVLRALTAGVESKLNVSDTLTSTSPIALVDSIVTVQSILIQPLAAETIEEYRQKIIDSYRLEPQGGAGTDYRIWSSDAAGVKTVYPYAKTGFPCEINLFVEATTIDSIDGFGTPSAFTLTDVETVVNFNPNVALALNERGRRPLQVVVNYLPVTIKTINIIITGYIGITPAIQAILLTAIKSAIDLIRPFVDSTDILSSKNNTLDNNKIITAILNQTPGATFSSVSFTVNGVPLSVFVFNNGDIPNLNLITYV